MLLKLTGSSCSGKSTLAFTVAGRLRQVAVHDFDEAGVPPGADLRWRQRMTEHWVLRALEYQDDGIDLLLPGQSPLGEVLAAPSAPLLDGIAVCLVDVADDIRRARLAARGTSQPVGALINWAAWHRSHAHDPQHRPAVITAGSWPDMAWNRWNRWTAADPRWACHRLDTTGRAIAESASQLEQWVTAQRAAHHAGTLPLTRGWACRSPCQ
jgi:hypothetical protein